MPRASERGTVLVDLRIVMPMERRWSADWVERCFSMLAEDRNDDGVRGYFGGALSLGRVFSLWE